MSAAYSDVVVRGSRQIGAIATLILRPGSNARGVSGGFHDTGREAGHIGADGKITETGKAQVSAPMSIRTQAPATCVKGLVIFHCL